MASQEFLLYNGFDVAATQTVYERLSKELEDHPNREIYDWTVRLFGPLMFMMSRGVRIDHERLQRTKVETEKKIDELLAQIEEKCGRPINPNSSQDCIKYFYIEKGISPYYNRKTGKPTVDDIALQRLARGTSARRGLQEARLIQEYKRLQTLKTRYLDMEFDEDNRLRCFYNPRGSRFSRLSSSKTVFGTGMNMQNLTDEFKDFIVPDPGYILLELDKRQAEWVVVAYDCGDASMINVVEQGKDPHTYTAQQMFRLPAELIDYEAKLVGHSTDPVEIQAVRERIENLRNYKGWLIRNMSLRQAGKKSNHGLNYDEGYTTFSLINGIPQLDAKRLIELYHSTYPGVRRWHETIKRRLAKDRTLVNCFGRHYTFMDKWGDSLFKAAYSFNPQSTIGDLTNRALIHVYEDNDPDMRKLEILAQVHDSILFQYPLDAGPDKIARVIGRIEGHMNPTLVANGREFEVATDLKLSTTSWRQMDEIPLTERDIKRAVEKRIRDG